MSTWAPNTVRVDDRGFGSARTTPATGMYAHHQANGAGGDMVGYMAGPNERNSHPNYATDKQGNLVGIVHPDRAPSSTYGHNQGTLAVEIANVAGAPNWDVPDNALEQVARAVAHHAIQSPRENRVEKNQPGVTQTGFWFGWHSQVQATECPGPDVRANIDWVIDRANQIIREGGAAPAPAPAPAGTGGSSAPAFPLPGDWYYGPEDGPAESVSGYHGNVHGTAAQHQANIARLQTKMIDRGWLFPLFGADGLYGDETEGNVRAFQAEKGLKVDGLVGPKTWAAVWTEPVT